MCGCGEPALKTEAYFSPNSANGGDAVTLYIDIENPENNGKTMHSVTCVVEPLDKYQFIKLDSTSILFGDLAKGDDARKSIEGIVLEDEYTVGVKVKIYITATYTPKTPSWWEKPLGIIDDGQINQELTVPLKIKN